MTGMNRVKERLSSPPYALFIAQTPRRGALPDYTEKHQVDKQEIKDFLARPD